MVVFLWPLFPPTYEGSPQNPFLGYTRTDLANFKIIIIIK